MPKRSKPLPPSADDAAPASRYQVSRYGSSRYFAVHAGTALVTVTVYKRGAAEVVQRWQALEQQLAGAQRVLEEARCREPLAFLCRYSRVAIL